MQRVCQPNPLLANIMPNRSVEGVPTHPDLQAEDVGTQVSDAFKVGELIRKNYARLLRIVRAKVRDADLAADLLHEASVIAMERAQLNRLAASERVPGFVLGIVVNLLRNHRRDPDNRLDLRCEDDAAHQKPYPDSEDQLDTERLKKAVRTVIAALGTARDREIVRRFYLDEEDKEAICREMNLKALRFDKVMHRARQRMKEVFESQGLHRSQFFSLLL
jgi:RNA polymerase sigma-70 factor (ECF subfamily)